VSALATHAVCAQVGNQTFAYKATNLVSNGAVAATTTDAQLLNPWGIAIIPGAPFWIADNRSGVSTLYDGKGGKIPLTVTVPPRMGAPAGTAGTPTGIVFNPNPLMFLLAPSAPALFIFATADGTISGWNPGVNMTSAVVQADESQSGAVYKGLALATNSTGLFLYATNFHNGTVDVFDSKFQPAKLAGSFSDPNLPSGYAPFGIALIDGNLVVTYALQGPDKTADQPGLGHGFVDVFDTDGNLITRFASNGVLNSPWGIATAPFNFGPLSSRILIGNFGDGRINAFDSKGTPIGEARDASGNAIVIDGLWAIVFGTAAASDPGTLYFTAGPNGQANGVFGSLAVVPANP
jgi:uncharacterized protein (TIGR03118 family)